MSTEHELEGMEMTQKLTCVGLVEMAGYTHRPCGDDAEFAVNFEDGSTSLYCRYHTRIAVDSDERPYPTMIGAYRNETGEVVWLFEPQTDTP